MPIDEWDEYVQAMCDGRYFEAHEILERPWRKNRNARYQIAIWLAAAFVHWSKSQYTGARRLLGRILKSPDTTDLPIRQSLELWTALIASTQSRIQPTSEELERLAIWGRGQLEESPIDQRRT